MDCSQIGRSAFSDNVFSDHCDKVAKYLYYIKEKENEDENYNNRCRCLNYILNTRTTFNSVSNKKGPELFPAYKEISSKLNTCHLIIDSIQEEDLKKITKLFVLHNSLDKLQKSIAENDEHIYNNAEVFAQHYRDAMTDCQDNHTDSYCVSLKEIELYCYYHTNSQNCLEIAKLLKYQMQLKKALKVSVPCIIILAIPFFSYILYKVNSCYTQIFP